MFIQHGRYILFYVGFTPDPAAEQERTVVWTRQHYKEEFELLVASHYRISSSDTDKASSQAVPVNLLSVNIPIQFRVNDVRAWTYNHVHSDQILENLANREVVRYLINVDIEDIMGPGRLKAAEELRRNLQARANDQKLGVEIVFVGLQGIHPPVKIAEAFEEVVGAMQDKQTNILAASTYAAEIVPQAMADATNSHHQS